MQNYNPYGNSPQGNSFGGNQGFNTNRQLGVNQNNGFNQQGGYAQQQSFGPQQGGYGQQQSFAPQQGGYGQQVNTFKAPSMNRLRLPNANLQQKNNDGNNNPQNLLRRPGAVSRPTVSVGARRAKVGPSVTSTRVSPSVRTISPSRVSKREDVASSRERDDDDYDVRDRRRSRDDDYDLRDRRRSRDDDYDVRDRRRSREDDYDDDYEDDYDDYGSSRRSFGAPRRRRERGMGTIFGRGREAERGFLVETEVDAN